MRLLIVDDETTIVNLLKKKFEAECFSVDVAYDGQHGLFLALTNGYDVVILDNNLPKKNGLDICRQIRQAGKHTPVLMLSVVIDVPKKIELFEAGADDYITKPFSFGELLARVRAMLRRPPGMVEDILTIDDLTLDTKRHILSRGKKQIYLTKKEFMLLEYFMRNSGQVLSRGMIMEHVWDINADIFSNTIETHILSLRKKIDYARRQKLIHTVPGRGYRLHTSSH